MPFNGRHEQEIAKVSDSGSAQVGVAKSNHGLVLVVIPSAPVPSLRSIIRAKLDHAKRHCGAWINMPVGCGAHKGIHIA